MEKVKGLFKFKTCHECQFITKVEAEHEIMYYGEDVEYFCGEKLIPIIDSVEEALKCEDAEPKMKFYLKY